MYLILSVDSFWTWLLAICYREIIGFTILWKCIHISLGILLMKILNSTGDNSEFCNTFLPIITLRNTLSPYVYYNKTFNSHSGLSGMSITANLRINTLWSTALHTTFMSRNTCHTLCYTLNNTHFSPILS